MSSIRGTIILKKGSKFILGRWKHNALEAATEFFTHEIFKYPFTDIWPEFRAFHLSTLSSQSHKDDQPKSLFLESGLQLELEETLRDFSSRPTFREFLTNYLITALSQLSGSNDGFYDDLHGSETWVFIDYVNKLIYINGEKVYEPGVKPPKLTPIMLSLKTGAASKKGSSIVFLALDRLKENQQILKFYLELIEWLAANADFPEDRLKPIEAADRMIGYEMSRFTHSTVMRWRQVVDFDYPSITLEFTNFKLLKEPIQTLETEESVDYVKI